MKNFNNNNFLMDLKQRDWSRISMFSNPNEMWSEWKNMLMTVIDKHAPVKTKRVGRKKSPWITSDLSRKMKNRDLLKKKVILTKDQVTWNEYKKARNESNNAVKNAKSKYFKDNLDANKNDPKKTRKLINELNSNQQKGSKVNEIKINNSTPVSPPEIAEAFNVHFTNIGPNLTSGISFCDIPPENYLTPPKTTFSLRNTSVNKVRQLLKNLMLERQLE